MGLRLWPRFISAKAAGNDSSAEPSKELDGPPAVSYQSRRGFALKSNESHMMRVSIESSRPIEAIALES